MMSFVVVAFVLNLILIQHIGYIDRMRLDCYLVTRTFGVKKLHNWSDAFGYTGIWVLIVKNN